ncbi:MAG TPA: hypothetical protein K8V41_02525 [Ligilactobacillus saerimneri]|nr:hypothetical protein [Ligilactobacillus saerimneri]
MIYNMDNSRDDRETKLFNSPLVIDAYDMATADGIKTTIPEIANALIEAGMITQDGEPTARAIKEGLVERKLMTDHDAIADFKAKYKEFALLSDEYFKVIDGVVHISETGLIILGEKLNRDLLGELKNKFPDKY